MPLTRRTLLRSTAVAALASSFLPSVGRGLAKKIKIGQIGTQHAHAGGKMSTMRKFSDLYEVVGVVEADAAQRKRVEETDIYGGLRWMTSDQLLETPGLEAVAVETEVSQLLETASQCIAAGMHIHLDKPAGDSLPEFRQLLDAATAKDRVVQMGYMYRYNPAFQFAFQAVRDGWLGEIFEVDTVMSKQVNDASRRELEVFAGGSMFELGCHVIDAVVTILGEPDRVTPFNRKTMPTKDQLLDNCLAIFEYPRATATVRSAVVEVDGGRRRQFVVCGTHGSLEIKPLEPPALTLTLDRDRGNFRRGTHDVPLEPLGGRYDGDFLDLARIIRGDKKSDFPPTHDLVVQRAILEASGMSIE